MKRSALVQILQQCNFRCRHCSQAAPHVGQEATKFVSLDTLRQTLARLKHQGLERVRFTGGEPLLHPDIPGVVALATSLGLESSVVTNGSLLAQKARGLQEAGITSVWISIYGVNASSYSATAARPAAGSALKSVIRMLTEGAVPVGLYCPIELDNLTSDFSLLEALLEAGATRVKYIQLMEQGRQLDNACANSSRRPLPESLAIIQTLSRRWGRVRFQISMRSGQADVFFSAGIRPPADRSCSAGSPDSWAVDAAGNEHPCCLLLGAAKDREQRTLVFVPPSSERNFQQVKTPASDKDMGRCFALANYGDAPAGAFACPLKYADIG